MDFSKKGDLPPISAKPGTADAGGEDCSPAVQRPGVSRTRVAVAAAAVVIAGLGARYGLTGWCAKYLGVALWDTLAYLLVLGVRPRWSPRRCGLAAVAIGWAIECAQLTSVPAWLSARYIVLRWIFGIGFSNWDLPAYVAGAVGGIAIHVLLLRLGQRSAGSGGASRTQRFPGSRYN